MSPLRYQGETGETAVTHRNVFEALRRAGIGRQYALHTGTYPALLSLHLGFKEGYCPEAERYYREAVSIPMHCALTVEQQEHVIAAVRQAVQ